MYEYPNNPADSNADEVVAWLKTNPPVEQRDDVLKAEASDTGKNRKSVLEFASADPTPPADPDAPADPAAPVTAPDPDAPAPPVEPEPAAPAPEPDPNQTHQNSDKPVWFEETQGKVPDEKKDLYRVIPVAQPVSA